MEQQTQGGASLASIAASLARIERTLEAHLRDHQADAKSAGRDDLEIERRLTKIESRIDTTRGWGLLAAAASALVGMVGGRTGTGQ